MKDDIESEGISTSIAITSHLSRMQCGVPEHLGARTDFVFPHCQRSTGCQF
jgi:hypothetical protein